MATGGETVTITRISGEAPNQTVVGITVGARVTGYQPQELMNGITQGDRRVILLVADLATWPVSSTVPDKTDRLTIDGESVNIIAVDATTRKVAGTLIAYELQVRGA